MLARSLFVMSLAATAHSRVVVVKDRQAAAPAPSVVFDGRVKAAATQADFDSGTGPFGKDFVKGQSQ